MTNVLILFFRYPRLGKVKTRLAEGIGAEKALELYVRLLQRTIDMAQGMSQCRLALCVEPAQAVRPLKKKFGKGADIFAQKGKDLGPRMRQAIAAVLNRGADKAVLVGVDIPGLSKKIIAAAFSELDHRPVVLGPAADGGYYLIGMKRLIPELFSGIPWGTGVVFSRTLAILEQAEIGYSLLPELHDVDSADDLPRARGRLR